MSESIRIPLELGHDISSAIHQLADRHIKLEERVRELENSVKNLNADILRLGTALMPLENRITYLEERLNEVALPVKRTLTDKEQLAMDLATGDGVSYKRFRDGM